MTSDPTTPTAWGIRLSKLWGPRFPVDVRQIALQYSAQRFDDPIHAIKEADVGGRFEGALFPLNKRNGWAILYNPKIASAGRINFTLGHELGHYLCHRLQNAGGFECSEQGVLGFDRDEARRNLEREADVFASYLLMPIDDFRDQVRDQPLTMELMAHCANRYGVSLTAACVKWIEFTPMRAALVWADNGRVLWGRRSGAAKKQGVYFPLGMELPVGSLAARGPSIGDPDRAGVKLPAGVWQRREAVTEFTIFSDRYEATISLLLIDERDFSGWHQEEDVEDTFDRFTRNR
jgi:hypothetical protein